MDSLAPPPPGSGKTLMERVEDSLLPLINLVFLLLMFFIVAGRLTDAPLPQLPGTASGEGQQKPVADLILKADGSWQVGGETVTADTLLQRLPEPDEDSPLRLAAEKDLAMSELFGGFGSGFYRAYREAWPLQPGYEAARRAVYQLYYLLVHVNLFGSGYVGRTRSALGAAGF